MNYTKILFAALLLCFSFTAFSQEKAEMVIQKAQKQAKLENKNVMVFFHASWCSWCKLMEKKMNRDDTKELFEKSYVLASLDVQERGEKKKLENPGGAEFMAKYGGEKAGLPFFVFITPEGEVIENSLTENKENLGCPSTEEEVKLFVEKLKKTSKLNEEQVSTIAKVFLEK